MEGRPSDGVTQEAGKPVGVPEQPRGKEGTDLSPRNSRGEQKTRSLQTEVNQLMAHDKWKMENSRLTCGG